MCCGEMLDGRVRRDRKGKEKVGCPLRRAGQGRAGNIAEQRIVKMGARRAGSVVCSKLRFKKGTCLQNQPGIGSHSFQNQSSADWDLGPA